MSFIYDDGLITYVVDGKVLAKIEFPANENGNIWDITHTFVDPTLRGQGIANQLLAEVMHLAKKQGKLVKATCPFAIKMFAVTPEYQALEVK